jgi:hypothetical protein
VRGAEGGEPGRVRGIGGGAEDVAPPAFAGARDHDAGRASLAERFRRHAAALARSGRSPLYVELMRGAADDLDRGGVVRDLFAGTEPGGSRAPAGAWPLAAATLRARFAEVRPCLALTVQTNEPGRAAVLYGLLLWLVQRHDLPVRLLEVSASAGLNLLVDRHAYRVDGALLGDPHSPLAFAEPWRGRPVPWPAVTASGLRVVERAGCDLAPLDPSSPDDRLTLLSYLWPDEPDRLARTRAALEVAARHPPPVAPCAAERWLPRVLAAARPGELTVLWQSVVRQYVPADVWREVERTVLAAGERATGEAPLAWVALEPGEDDVAEFVVSATTWPGGERRRLGVAGDHGPPVRWSSVS